MARPGGPASAGDTGSVSGLGDPTCRRAAKPVHHTCNTEARAPTAHALRQEKPLQREAHTPQLESSPSNAARESPHTAMKNEYSQQ